MSPHPVAAAGKVLEEAILKRRPPTVLDVAKRASVSVGTVSNVLSGRVKVSDAKRGLVLRAISDLSYTQNKLAQGLRQKRSPLIGLCVPFTSVSYFAALVDAFEEVASDRGFEIMQVLTRQEPEKELQRVKSMLRYHVGGIMMLPSVAPQRSFDLIAESGTPLVIIDRPTADPRFDQVTFDNYAAMHEAVSRLIALGHRHILFVVRQRLLSVTVDRVRGLEAAIRDSGKQVAVNILECRYDEAAFISRLESELKSGQRRPTAIVVSNSLLTTWTFRALRLFGIRCPDDVSLLSIDEPDWSDLVDPTLSTIRPPTRAIAFTAWDLLMRRMRNEAQQVDRVELRAEVIFRDSIAPPPRRKPARSEASPQRTMARS